jgi:hypothetical protein
MSGVKRFALGAVFALGVVAAILVAGRAEAKSHISVGIGFGAPVYAQPYYYPAPAYYAPAPVYVAPQPNYDEPPPGVIESPPPVYYAPPRGYYYVPRPIYERRAYREDDDD